MVGHRKSGKGPPFPGQQHSDPLPMVPCREHRMKEGMSNNSTTSISQARKAVEQLKMEAGMDRVKVNAPSMFFPGPEWPGEAQSPQQSSRLSGCVFVLEL